MGALLLMISMVTGSTLASTATGLQPIPALVNHYAEEHLTRGGILVGVDVRGETHWYSSRNLTANTYFEIGSVTKTLTGMLLAAEISAGRVTEETTVGELWPERSESTGAAELAIPAVPEDLSEVTVGQLATHTSGLPRVNLTPRRLVRAVLRQDDPYAGLTATDVYRDAASASLSEPETFQYSNLGYALLGVLLAADSAEPSSYTEQYLDAVHAGVLAPLGLPRFSITTNSEELPTAYTVNGRRAEYWTFDGYAAAGGVVASAADVLRWV